VNPNQDMELPKGDAASSGKKKKQKKQKSNKTQSLNDFLARPSVGSKYSSKDPPKRTDSWADAMDERGDAEGRQVKGATGELVKVFLSPCQRFPQPGREEGSLTDLSCRVLLARLKPGILTGVVCLGLLPTLCTLETSPTNATKPTLCTSLRERT
jgi:hypothetical protein